MSIRLKLPSCQKTSLRSLRRRSQDEPSYRKKEDRGSMGLWEFPPETIETCLACQPLVSEATLLCSRLLSSSIPGQTQAEDRRSKCHLTALNSDTGKLTHKYMSLLVRELGFPIPRLWPLWWESQGSERSGLMSKLLIHPVQKATWMEPPLLLRRVPWQWTEASCWRLFSFTGYRGDNLISDANFRKYSTCLSSFQDSENHS